ncbi:MAG: hypothetical protein ACE5H0_08725 [Bacteroidota bacterium]
MRFLKLSTAAAAFDHRTRLVESTLDVRKEVWRLGFDNGHTIILSARGECQVVRE